MDPKKQLFTTGQFAKLNEVNKRTLHFYDEAGLFSPACKGENGYRYYTYEQSLTLEMLLAFRELGMSLEEIKSYMEHPSAGLFRELARKKSSEIDRTIQRLKGIKEILEEHEAMLTLSESADVHQITLMDCPEEYLALSPAVSDTEDEITVYMNHLKEARSYLPYRKNFGCMLSAEKIEAGNFEDYDYLFTRINHPGKKKSLYKKPKGRYLQAFCKGDWDKIPDVYFQIIQYARAHRLQLCGYAYEIGLNEMAITTMEEYITMITIRCEQL